MSPTMPEYGMSSVGQFLMSSSNLIELPSILMLQATSVLLSPTLLDQPHRAPGPRTTTNTRSPVQFTGGDSDGPEDPCVEVIGVGAVGVWMMDCSQAANDSTQPTSADENVVERTRHLTVGIVTTSNVAVNHSNPTQSGSHRSTRHAHYSRFSLSRLDGDAGEASERLREIGEGGSGSCDEEVINFQIGCQRVFVV